MGVMLGTLVQKEGSRRWVDTGPATFLVQYEAASRAADVLLAAKRPPKKPGRPRPPPPPPKPDPCDAFWVSCRSKCADRGGVGLAHCDPETGSTSCACALDPDVDLLIFRSPGEF